MAQQAQASLQGSTAQHRAAQGDVIPHDSSRLLRDAESRAQGTARWQRVAAVVQYKYQPSGEAVLLMHTNSRRVTT